jgi:hypothetical protein
MIWVFFQNFGKCLRLPGTVCGALQLRLAAGGFTAAWSSEKLCRTGEAEPNLSSRTDWGPANVFYSARNACIGSTCIALRAG